VSSGEQTPETNLLEQDPRVAEFVAAFRESKHYLLNSVAIWTAQAQLAVRNPDFREKLAQSILERSDKLVELTRDTEAKLMMFAPYRSEASKPQR
jgi:phage shock protein A